MCVISSAVSLNRFNGSPIVYLMLTDASLFTRVIRDLSGAVERIDGRDVDRVVSCISNARHVSVFGCGREGL